MRKMTALYKISYSALFIALGIILSRFLSISYLFGLPFLKISFAPSVVMFASFYLGPIYGFIVGTAVDVLGALLYPMGAFNPLYTIAASLTGLIPFLAYRVINATKVENKFPFILTIILTALNIFVIWFMATHDVIYSESGRKTYELYPRIKWGLSSTFVVLSIAFVIGVIIIRKKFAGRKFNKYYNSFVIASSVYVTYFLFKIPVGSFVQSALLNYDFMIVLTVRMLTGFLTSFVHIVIILIALDVSLRFNVEGALLSKPFSFIKRNKMHQNNDTVEQIPNLININEEVQDGK